ncbi:hypothetical protein [Acinetobacter schindleri]|nr:hypothetical protein [Acinetobacter schindleri]
MDALLQEGSVISIGDNYLELVIIKRVVNNSGVIKDDRLIVIGAYIAVLKGCEALIKPAKRAVYFENTTIGACLRSAGGKLKVLEDVPLMRYLCALGATPTYEIARKCAEEGSVIYCNAQGKVIIKRLSKIMNQEPVAQWEKSSVQWVQNQTKLDHAIPTYQTVAPDGSTVEGTLTGGSKTSFYPNLDARRVKNLSTVLVTRGTLMRAYSPEIIAGQVVLIEGKKYVILTAAHRFDTGVLGGPTVSASKFWLAEVVSV